MESRCTTCRGSGHNMFDGSRCLTCNGTGNVGTPSSFTSPKMKKTTICPICGKMFHIICTKCGYSVSSSFRKKAIINVIESIKHFERSVGASSDKMTLEDFNNALAELNTETPLKKWYYKDRTETLTE